MHSSRAKTVIPRDNLYSVLPFLLEEWMASLPCLAAVIKITSKQKTISQISRGRYNVLWTLTLD